MIMVRVLMVMCLIPALSLGLVSAASAQERETPVVARIATRDRIVVIRSSSEGPQYTVKTEKGEVLDANLSDRDFQTKHRDIYERIKPAIASPNDKVILWGGM
jgi:hypothetical protein